MRSRTVTTLVCPARAAISLGETLGLPTKLVDARSSIQPQRPYGCTADAMAGTLRFRESDGRWIGEVYVGRDPRGKREFLTRSQLRPGTQRRDRSACGRPRHFVQPPFMARIWRGRLRSWGFVVVRIVGTTSVFVRRCSLWFGVGSFTRQRSSAQVLHRTWCAL